MNTKTNLNRALMIAACTLSLAACKTAPVAPPAPPKLQEILSEASQVAAMGQKEQAVGLWKQASKIYPTDKTPWTNIAQSRYESGQYGEAIVSAQEVLVRDPNDKLANSIIATSGLRLATRALGELSRQSGLVGPLRSESQELAKLLRETLGENNLFSDVPAPAVKSATPPVRKEARAARAVRVETPKPKDSSDPFGALK